MHEPGDHRAHSALASGNSDKAETQRGTWAIGVFGTAGFGCFATIGLCMGVLAFLAGKDVSPRTTNVAAMAVLIGGTALTIVVAATVGRRLGGWLNRQVNRSPWLVRFFGVTGRMNEQSMSDQQARDRARFDEPPWR